MVGHLVGRFLAMLVAFGRPQHVLEVGTFTGYSSLSMAEALPPGGRIVTLELSDEHAALARRHIAASPYADRIEIRIAHGELAEIRRQVERLPKVPERLGGTAGHALEARHVVEERAVRRLRRVLRVRLDHLATQIGGPVVLAGVVGRAQDLPEDRYERLPGCRAERQGAPRRRPAHGRGRRHRARPGDHANQERQSPHERLQLWLHDAHPSLAT